MTHDPLFQTVLYIAVPLALVWLQAQTVKKATPLVVEAPSVVDDTLDPIQDPWLEDEVDDELDEAEEFKPLKVDTFLTKKDLVSLAQSYGIVLKMSSKKKEMIMALNQYFLDNNIGENDDDNRGSGRNV